MFHTNPLTSLDSANERLRVSCMILDETPTHPEHIYGDIETRRALKSRILRRIHRDRLAVRKFERMLSQS